MTNIKAILEIINDKEIQLSTLSTLYKGEDDSRVAKYEAQKDALEMLKSIIAGDEIEIRDDRTVIGEICSPTCGWTAFIVQAFGGHTVTIFGSPAAASDAMNEFCREHETQIEYDVRCHTVGVTVNDLSQGLQASSDPRFAYAFVYELGGDYGSVSLHDTPEEADAQVDEFEADNAYHYERDDAYCTWCTVALPRIKQ